MKIYSIRERPDLIPAMLDSLEEHWPACMPWIKKHMETVLRSSGPIPDAYIAVEKGQVVGGYTLAIKQILYSEEEGLWIATLYVDPKFRGEHLSPILIDHARRQGGALGYEKIYLASEHCNLPWQSNRPLELREVIGYEIISFLYRMKPPPVEVTVSFLFTL